jgi:hypothetical protein
MGFDILVAVEIDPCIVYGVRAGCLCRAFKQSRHDPLVNSPELTGLNVRYGPAADAARFILSAAAARTRTVAIDLAHDNCEGIK